jgi:hypothetical protein
VKTQRAATWSEQYASDSKEEARRSRTRTERFIREAENTILGPRLWVSNTAQDLGLLMLCAPARLYELLDDLLGLEFICAEEVELAKNASALMLTAETVSRALKRSARYYSMPLAPHRDEADWTSDKAVAEFQKSSFLRGEKLEPDDPPDSRD